MVWWWQDSIIACEVLQTVTITLSSLLMRELTFTHALENRQTRSAHTIYTRYKSNKRVAKLSGHIFSCNMGLNGIIKCMQQHVCNQFTLDCYVSLCWSFFVLFVELFLFHHLLQLGSIFQLQFFFILFILSTLSTINHYAMTTLVDG